MPHDLKEMLISTYDQIVQEYVQHEFNSPVMEKHYQRFMQGLPQGGRVFDVGCGPGQAASRFSSRGYQVIGIDLSEKMLESARTAVPEGTFYQMDVENITLTEKFHGIWAAFILVHVQRQFHKNIVKRFFKLLEPNGLLYLGMLEGQGERVMPEPYNRSLQQFFVFSSQQETENILREVGFKVEDYTVQDFDEEGEIFRISSTFARSPATFASEQTS